MPTKKPRIAITLAPGLHQTIRRLAAFQRMSMARVVTELLTEIEPILQSTVAALEDVQRSKGKPAAALVTAMTRMQGAVEQLSQEVTGQLDFLRPIAAGQGADAPAKRSDAGAPLPPRVKRRRKAVKSRKQGGRT